MMCFGPNPPILKPVRVLMKQVIEWKDFVEQISSYLADALHSNNVKLAISKIDSTKFDIDDLGEIFNRLRSENETATVLIFCSYLEEKFYQLLVRHLQYLDSAKSRNELFGASGPLHSFYSRVAIAYHLGWISPQTKLKMDALRKIRNEFSHRAFSVSFKDPLIEQQFAVICDDLEDRLHPVLQASEEWLETLNYSIKWDQPIEGKTRKLCGLAMLAQRVFLEMLSLPVSKEVRVGMDDLRKAEVVNLSLRAGIAATLNVLIALGHISKRNPQAELTVAGT
jgi:hypothetical protein